MEYQLKDKIALISIDDGKANAVSHTFIDRLNQYLDQADKEASAVILHGREGMFSAGFDLKELAKGRQEIEALVGKGMALLARLYALRQPLISMCEGHAIGMGAFLLLVSDMRLGGQSEYNVSLPETAIGMPFTPLLMSLIHARMNPGHKNTAVLQSRPCTPDEAIAAGFLDQLVTAEQLMPQAIKVAEALIELPATQYQANKLHLREAELKIMRKSLR